MADLLYGKDKPDPSEKERIKIEKRLFQIQQMKIRAAKKAMDKKKLYSKETISRCMNKPIKKKQRSAKKLSTEYQSIFTSSMKYCYMTGSDTNVCPHHIFYGDDKEFSEKYHFMLPLRIDWHTGENYAIHNDRKFDLEMKIRCQEYWINVLGKTKEQWHKEKVPWYSKEDLEHIA